MTLKEYTDSELHFALHSSPFILCEWVEYTDRDKYEDASKKLIGGHQKRYSFKEAFNNWWANMEQENKDIILNNEYFDKAVFNEIAQQTLVE